MTKFSEIYNKYYETQFISTIRDYFLNSTSSEIWKQLKSNIDNGYIVVPNINAWSRDFIYGGSIKVSLLNMILEPFTHNINKNDFNAYGNVAYGDMMSVLRTCNDYRVDTVEVMDFGTTIVAIALMKVLACRIKKSYEQNDIETDICKATDWLTRSSIAMLSLPEEASNTKYILHFPTIYEINAQLYTLNKEIRKITMNTPKKFYMSMRTYQFLLNSAYFVYVSGLKLKENFCKPNIVFHEVIATEFEKSLLIRSEYFKTPENVYEVFNNSTPEEVYKSIRNSLTKAEKRYMDDMLKSETGEESVFSNEPGIEYVYRILHSRRVPPDGISIIQENPCRSGKKEIVKTPIASCVIDVDKYIFNNSTKDEDFIVNSVLMMYSNAQDINKVRTSLQSNGTDRPLLVTFKLSNEKILNKLKPQIDRITTTIRSVSDEDYVYEFKEDL